VTFDPDLARLKDVLGEPVPDDVLMLALTHRSFSYENGQLPTNERLEFLGDAVLGLVVTEYLYRSYPDETEGFLAKVRAAVVNAAALADLARSLGLGAHIYVGRGEESTGGRDKTSILADTLEAVLGAIYLSLGPARARAFIESHFIPLIHESAEMGAGLDWKTSLQEVAAERGRSAPEYRVSWSGPEHAKHFSAAVWLDNECVGTGEGSSKKIAEQQAAAHAYENLTSSPAGRA
jgi:ribonuclease-3